MADAVRRVRGDGWYADVPADAADAPGGAWWLDGAAVRATMAPDDDEDVAPPAVVLRGRVLHTAADGAVVASCGGLLAAATPARPLAGDAVRVVLQPKAAASRTRQRR
jgi:hypothetical protein